ncbi:MAG: class I SAM-dependent methyltransferase, partial [Simkaniaceae bacterium]|nr:class I SAM-dependent methyltransferase [Simkaniaceae bacterium]
KYGKKYIDQNFPGRHTLIQGNSNLTVPKFTTKHPNKTFDLIFIDGGHTYQCAKSDILNMQALAHKDTIVVIDDVSYQSVMQAWEEAIQSGIVKETERIQFPYKFIAIGKYCMKNTDEFAIKQNAK